MNQVIVKRKLSAEQKLEKINQQIADKIACRNQNHRQLDILREENLAEEAVEIPQIHINHRIKPNRSAIKHIYEQPA